MGNNFVGYRASFVEKLFKNWSHGTFYNRVESLGIKDNADFFEKNSVSGTILYSKKAVELLAKQYAKEFSLDFKKIADNVDEYLSMPSSSYSRRVVQRKSVEKNGGNDKVDKIDEVVEKEKVNFVNASVVNEKYVLRVEHDSIVKSLKDEVEFLRKSLEKATEEKNELTEIMKLREQKEIVVEQQKLQTLMSQNEKKVELIADSEENSRGGFWGRLKERLFG